ncbi:MAG: hypothetical protein SFY81_04785 [Verrucomicrobiota bacterium]|nr:hypothetical protein [Verrucomicrobiota bacterium]
MDSKYSFQNEWKNYRDQVYPGGTSDLQNKECNQAFFAGALSLLVRMEEVSMLPGAEAIAALHAIRSEIIQVNRERAALGQARN